MDKTQGGGGAGFTPVLLVSPNGAVDVEAPGAESVAQALPEPLFPTLSHVASPVRPLEGRVAQDLPQSPLHRAGRESPHEGGSATPTPVPDANEALQDPLAAALATAGGDLPGALPPPGLGLLAPAPQRCLQYLARHPPVLCAVVTVSLLLVGSVGGLLATLLPS